jgi:prepilin-type N-terminal cleavage/methylation domain-containing protein
VAIMRLRRGADGFTLVELLVAIVILSIITVPLSNVVIGFFRSADATTARLIESHDVQIATVYWAQDVASIGTRSTTSPFALNQSVETGVAYNAGLYQCGAAGTPSAIVRLAWDQVNGPAAPATIVRVAYVRQAGPGQTKLTELHRLRCEGSTAVVSDVTVAHDLDPSTLPVLVCSTTCTASLAVPKSVSLTLNIKDPKNLGAAYVVKLTGQRRQS